MFNRSAAAPAGSAGRDARRSSIWYSLRVHQGFRTLITGTLATNAAFWMWTMVSGWLALVLTDSPFFVGLTGFLGGIPMLFLALPVGVLIDRMDRRKLLLGAQVVVMVVSILVSVLLFLDWLQPWQLLAASLVVGSAMSLIFPVRNALVANLVPREDLANAVALNSTAQNAPRIIGPALAGPLISMIGLAGAFLVCAVIQILAFVITLRVPRQPRVSAPSGVRRTMLGSMGEGLTVIRQSRYLSGIIILAIIPTVLVLPYLNLMPVFARDVLAVGSTGLGLIMAASGVGGVIGSLIVAGSSRILRVPGILLWTSAMFGVLVAIFSFTPVPLLAGMLVFLAGFSSAAYLALNNTELQLNIDDRVRGRVLSVYMLTWGLFPLGLLPMGMLADQYGAPISVGGMAILNVVLVALIAVLFPSLRGTAAAKEPLSAVEQT